MASDGSVVILIEGDDEQFESTLKGLGGTAKTAAKSVAAVFTAATASVAALTKNALDSYAAFEQLAGGVETLFGTRGAKTVEEYATLVGQSVDYVAAEYEMLQQAQADVMRNASNAYKTAGLSANAYMETVTSIAAALKQSTASELEAAEYGMTWAAWVESGYNTGEFLNVYSTVCEPTSWKPVQDPATGTNVALSSVITSGCAYYFA